MRFANAACISLITLPAPGGGPGGGPVPAGGPGGAAAGGGALAAGARCSGVGWRLLLPVAIWPRKAGGRAPAYAAMCNVNGYTSNTLYARVRIHMTVDTNVYAHVYAHVYTCLFMSIHAYTCLCTCPCTCLYTCLYSADRQCLHYTPSPSVCLSMYASIYLSVPSGLSLQGKMPHVHKRMPTCVSAHGVSSHVHARVLWRRADVPVRRVEGPVYSYGLYSYGRVDVPVRRVEGPAVRPMAAGTASWAS